MSTLFLATYLLLWGITLLLCILVIAALRHIGFLFEVIDPVYRLSKSALSLPTGTTLPNIDLQDVVQGTTNLSQFSGHNVLLLLIQPKCTPCEQLLEQILTDGIEERDRIWKLVILVIGDLQTAVDLHHKIQHDHDNEIIVLSDPTRQAVKAWGVSTTPLTIVLDQQGVIRDIIISPDPKRIIHTLRLSSLYQGTQSTVMTG